MEVVIQGWEGGNKRTLPPPPPGFSGYGLRGWVAQQRAADIKARWRKACKLALRPFVWIVCPFVQVEGVKGFVQAARHW